MNADKNVFTNSKMCINKAASLTAFTIGIAFCLILYAYKYPIFYISMLFFITLMQLVEYFTHHSILTNNKNLNRICVKLILILLFIQPIIYSFMCLQYPPHHVSVQDNKLNPPLLICYCLVFLFMYNYFDVNNTFSATYLTSCSSICRLKWFRFNNTSALLAFMFVIMYLLLFVNYTFVDSHFKYKIISHFIPKCLIIACIYTLTLSNYTVFDKFASVGSLWCFLAVFAGPVLLFTYRN
jgi:hypothetical protein